MTPDPSTPDAPAPLPTDSGLPRISALSLLGPDGVAGPTHFLDLLQAASRQCRRLVGCDRVRIWVSRRGGRRLVAWDFPEDGGAPTELRLMKGEGLAGHVMRHEVTLRLGRNESRPADVNGEPESYRSALVIPLLRRGEPFGAIECLDKAGGDFTDADSDRLGVAAESVSLALDHALLSQEIERRALEKGVLLDITRALSAPLDLEEVIEAIFASLRQVVDYDAAAIYLVNRETRVLEMVSAAGYPEGTDEAFALQIGQGIIGWVVKHGEGLIVPDVAADRRYVAARPETRSEVAAPLVLEGRTIGVFNLENETEDAYHEGHLEMLSAFAAQAAVAIERARSAHERIEARRLEKELAIARDIQMSFLPGHAPHLPGFDLAGASIAHDEVGGDYYDFIPVSETRLGLAIADVSGKGIPAALIMAGFRMSLLAEIRNEFAIRAVMRKVNALLHESTDRDKFVTAFYGVLDWKNSVIIFSNAGHNPPLLLRLGGGVEELSDGGLAFGVLPDSHYEERPMPLRPGDVLVMYTDGVSEAENEMSELWGVQRLEDLVRTHAHESSADILEAVVEAVRQWTGERGPTDDLTLMVLRANDPAALSTTSPGAEAPPL